MEKVLKSEVEMIAFGEELGKSLKAPAVVELVGDVGTGKTTITKGIAKGLGILAEVTSPSFMISKTYDYENGRLVHYDFYRLNDPGIMSEDLLENINDKNTITIVEWADSVSDILPENHEKLEVLLNDDGTRTVRKI